MKAVICTRYGPPEVVHLTDVPTPTPAENALLVRIHAAAMTRGDIVDRSGQVNPAAWLPTRMMLGFTKPRRVIDYTREDFTRRAEAYDSIFDAVGKSSFRQCRRRLKAGGFYLTVIVDIGLLLRMLLFSTIRGRKVVTGIPNPKAADLHT